jgi:anti-sigma regulatory factor (Ser/Thr protein kinase)
MTAEGADHRHELSLDLPAVHRGVRVARNVVRHFARMQGVPDREVEYVMLVVSELLANAIDHGGGDAALTEAESGATSRMNLRFLVRPERWSLRVTDEGGGDPEEVRKLCESCEMPDLEDDRGRGLFLLSQMVDSMDIRRSESGDGLTIEAARRYAAPE